MSLRVKLIAFFLLVGLVPLTAIGVLSYTRASLLKFQEIVQIRCG